MPGYHDGNWNAGEYFAMAAMMLVFWGLVIGLVIVAARNLGGRGRRAESARTGTASPEDILNERYARGEIDETELLRGRELLDPSVGRVQSPGAG